MSDLVSELQQVMSRFDSCFQFSERTTLTSVYTFHLWFEQIKYFFQRVNGPLHQFLFDNVNTTGFEGSALVSFKIICDDILERYLFKSLSQDVYTVIRRKNARGHDALLLI